MCNRVTAITATSGQAAIGAVCFVSSDSASCKITPWSVKMIQPVFDFNSVADVNRIFDKFCIVLVVNECCVQSQ